MKKSAASNARRADRRVPALGSVGQDAGDGRRHRKALGNGRYGEGAGKLGAFC